MEVKLEWGQEGNEARHSVEESSLLQQTAKRLVEVAQVLEALLVAPTRSPPLGAQGTDR